MKLNLTNMINARRWTLLMSALLLSVITACGGGNGSAGAKLGSGPGQGTGTTTTSNGVISLKFTSAANTVTNVIPVTGYLTATANVVDASGNPVVGKVVTFTASNAAAVISPSLGTAITDNSGNAFVTIQPGTASGAGILTASVTAVGSTAITATGAYTLNAVGTTALPTLTLALSSCDNNNLSSACPLQVTATLKDGSGAVIPNQLVTFSATSALAALSPSSGTSLTNTAGTATTTVTPLNLAVALQQAGAAGTVNAAATYQGVTVTAQSYFTLGTTAISLALKTPSSGSATVPSYGTSVIAVQVNSGSGVAFTQLPVTINFTSGCQQSGKATLPATATTVNGIATVTYTDLGCGVTDTVTATTAGSSSTVSVNLAVTAPQANSIYFVSATPTTIAIPGSGGADTSLLTFTVTDTNGKPKSGVLVDFTNTSPGVAILTTPSATTDSNGQVSAAVTSGTTAGTFRITATVDGTTISTISGNVIVSQSIPVTASFTVAPVLFNIEGLNVVLTDKITAYLADANGNYVADGTPVLATTQGGAIGLDGTSGGCFTVGGNCTLTFTSQQPIPSNGLAVIQFSTSTGSGQINADPLTISMSGSEPYMFIAGATTLVPVPDGLSGASITNTDCSGNIVVVITDVNGNPLPFGTSVKVSSSFTNVSAGNIIPASVANTPPVPKFLGNPGIFPTSGALTNQMPYIQGTAVTLQIVISGQNPAGTTGLAAVCAPDKTSTNTSTLPLSVTVQTPKGTAKVYNLTLNYPIGP